MSARTTSPSPRCAWVPSLSRKGERDSISRRHRCHNLNCRGSRHPLPLPPRLGARREREGCPCPGVPDRRSPRGGWVFREKPYSIRYFGSVQLPQTHGKVQSAVSLALSGMYLLQASAMTGSLVCHTTSNWPLAWISPIITGFER